MKNLDLNARIIIVTGPTGAGKSFVVDSLKAQYPDLVHCPISVTTRAPRGNEQNGVQYWFVTKEEFWRRIEAGEFIEYEENHGNFYGTRVPAMSVVGERKILLDIDPKGAIKLADTYKGVRILWLTASEETIRSRLAKRNTSDEEVRIRLETAKTEMALLQEQIGAHRRRLLTLCNEDTSEKLLLKLATNFLLKLE